MAKLNGSKKTILILGITILALSAFYHIYFVQIVDQRNKHTEQIKRLLPFKVNSIHEIEVLNPFGKFRFRKAAGSWLMTSPVEAKADRFSISEIVDYLDRTSIKRTITAGADRPVLSKYGLQDPSIICSFWQSGNNKPWSLRLGDLAPDAMNVYITRSDYEGVSLIPMYVSLLLNKDAYHYREKAVFDFDIDQLRRVSIAFTTRQIVVEKSDRKGWSLMRPIAVEADTKAVIEYIKTIQQIQVSAFVGEQPKSLAQFGLDDPWAHISVEHGETHKETLLIGRASNDDGFYAKRADAANVVLIPWSVTHLFLEDMFPLRDKQLLIFQNHEIESFEIESVLKDTNIVLDQTGTETWHITSPQSLRADTEAVHNFFSDLRLLHAKRFLPFDVNADINFGLKNPRVRLSLKTKDRPDPIVIKIGQPWPENPEFVAACLSECRDIVLLDRKRINALQRSLHYFRYKQLRAFIIDEVRKVEIVFHERPLLVKRGKGRQWHAVNPAKMKMSNNLTVYLLLRDLWRLEFSRILSEEEARRAIKGASDIKIDIWLKDDLHLATYSVWYYRGSPDSIIVEVDGKFYLIEGKFVTLLRKHVQEVYGQIVGI